MKDTPRTDEVSKNALEIIETIQQRTTSNTPLKISHIAAICQIMTSYGELARQLERELAAVTKWKLEIMAALPCGYIPYHTPENAVEIIKHYLSELAELQEWKDDIVETHTMVMREPCESDDRIHCPCVPVLREELAAMTKERDEVIKTRDHLARQELYWRNETMKVDRQRAEAEKQRNEVTKDLAVAKLEAETLATSIHRSEYSEVTQLELVGVRQQRDDARAAVKKLEVALEQAYGLAVNGDIPNEATIEAWERILGLEKKGAIDDMPNDSLHGREGSEKMRVMNCTVEDLVRRGAFRRLLVGTGLVYEEALDDAENFDGETTLSRVVEFEESLIELLAPNAQGHVRPCSEAEGA